MQGVPPGNTYLPFEELMLLEKINVVTYRSIAPPFSPGDNAGRAYGGHVFAQAAWAASQTVASGFVLHTVTGYFLLPGSISTPFVYKIHIVRDGRGYCTRIVNVTQAEGRGVCFTCTCSFKKPEHSALDAQAKVDLWSRYGTVLKGKKPEDFPEAPGMDVPRYWRRMAATGYNDPFPGLDSRKVTMDAFNRTRSPLDKRHLLFYRIIGKAPDDTNLALCAHLYASDRNSLFIIANHFDVGDTFTQLGSLVHSVTFHAPVEALMMHAEDCSRRWFCKEDWTTRVADNRGMFHSHVWGPDGTHVATLFQDGMIRQPKDSPRIKERKERL
ncbi:Thioesterase/thiol ester dehydrase-isomerase [Polychaeton citri CBS 116435]|uniref:Thioesterase/thiol ester dehydrase-isomerase n=1 Tax=Polychaeton citri CBS 116435 TaxID=1314669 RepID=A0A9P4QFA2_9PEZI|nr:Thioesterase/thiol ester dehydrase-isomerase [Polychaeton citri CBS 116435]